MSQILNRKSLKLYWEFNSSSPNLKSYWHSLVLFVKYCIGICTLYKRIIHFKRLHLNTLELRLGLSLRKLYLVGRFFPFSTLLPYSMPNFKSLDRPAQYYNSSVRTIHFYFYGPVTLDLIVVCQCLQFEKLSAVNIL